MEIFTLVVVILVSITIAIFSIFKRSFSYWERNGVHNPTPTFPFGNIKNSVTQKCNLGMDLHDAYQYFKEKSLDVGGLYFFTRPVIVPINLDLIKRITITDFDHFTDRTFFSEDFDPMSMNLVAMKGHRWKEMRSKLQPAFTLSKIKQLFESVLSYVGDVERILDDCSEKNLKIDAGNLASRYSVDVISSCAFGIQCNSLQNPKSKIRNVVTKSFEPNLRNAIFFLIEIIAPKLLTFFRIRFHRKEVADFYTELLEKTINYRISNKVTRPDFIQMLLELRYDTETAEEKCLGDGEPQISMTEMAAQCMIFFVSGFETISCTITFCLYELARNEDIQEKARKEIQKLRGNKLTYNLLQDLEYLDKVVQETLRMYPPIPLHTRECTKDYKIPNSSVTIKKGCFMVLSALGIQRDPEIYPNPNVFDPERFTPENIKNRHPCAWMPFGIGPRKCIASQFGLMEIKILISSLLNRYKISLHPQAKQPLQMVSKGMLLLSDTPIWLNFEKL